MSAYVDVITPTAQKIRRPRADKLYKFLKCSELSNAYAETR